MGALRRREDWPEKLNAYIGTCWERPFEWGRFDCAIFAAGAVEAMTGEDPMAWARGRYASREEAEALIPGGVAAMAGKAARDNGWTEIPAGLAQRGDLAIVRTPEGPAFGIVFPGQPKVAAAARGGGVALLPLGEILKAWRV